MVPKAWGLILVRWFCLTLPWTDQLWLSIRGARQGFLWDGMQGEKGIQTNHGKCPVYSRGHWRGFRDDLAVGNIEAYWAFNLVISWSTFAVCSPTSWKKFTLVGSKPGG